MCASGPNVYALFEFDESKTNDNTSIVSNENWILYDLITDCERLGRMIGIVEAIEQRSDILQ